MRRRSFLGSAAATAALPRFAVGQQTSVLRVIPHANLSLLDPIFTTALISVNHGWAIYDTLFGITSRFEPRPQMAEGYTISDDGRTYIIKLRDGLKFHNGEPVRAQDAAPSLARWAKRDSLGVTLNGFVDTWGVQDDKTVKITLKQKLPMFLPALAAGGASTPFVVPEHVAKSDPFKQNTETIGSGPLKFVRSEFVPGSLVVYEKNKDYVPRNEPADWTSGGKVMHFDRVEWKVIPDAATASAAIQNGEVDWYEQVHPDLVAPLRKNPSIEIGSANPTGFNAVLRFNHLHPPFNNVAVRRAVMMAVSQDDYMSAITGNDHTAYRACLSMLPCGTKFARETGGPLMQGNIDKARAMLAAAGYKGEKVVVISPSDFPTIGPLGEVTHDILTKIGMNVEFVSTDWGTVTQRRASREPVEKGGWSVVHTWYPSNIGATPVEQFFIRGLGPSGWFGWYGDAETERLVQEWLVAQDAATAQSAADAVQARAFDQVPIVPLGQFQIRTARRKNIQGQIEGFGAYMWNIRRV
ncbi:MAG: ABC transporter substrate-binding protein [Acetobacteraceae bacterium]|nr:ABC transporter substrate-binding protein [Pseudomonadota bacterium]